MSGLFFNEYPYTDFHQLNLSWMVNDLQELRQTIEQFVSINALKYADPIQWNITTQYEKNTIVIDPQTGTAYISVQPVPSGVSLANTDYWAVVFDLGSFVTRAAKNFTSRYEEETTTTATFNTNAGEWLVWGDTLYVAKVNITAGDSYVIDGNIERITIEEVKNTIVNLIGELNNLSTTDKTNIVAAINEVLTTLANTTGDLNNLTTTDKSNLVAAINEVLTTLANTTGDLNDLTTTDKSSLVDAINEVNSTGGGAIAMIGDLNDLNTTDKSNVVNAVNEVLSSIPRFKYVVTDYGILPDSGDVYSELYDFLHDVVEPNGGGVVYFPEGTYTLSYTILIPSNTIFMGCGPATKIVFDETDTYIGVGLANGGSNIKICNMTVNTMTTGAFPFGSSAVGSIGIGTFDFEMAKNSHTILYKDNKNIVIENVWTDTNYLVQTEPEPTHEITNVVYHNLFAPNGCVSVMPDGVNYDIVLSMDNIYCDTLRCGLGNGLGSVYARNITCQYAYISLLNFVCNGMTIRKVNPNATGILPCALYYEQSKPNGVFNLTGAFIGNSLNDVNEAAVMCGAIDNASFTSCEFLSNYGRAYVMANGTPSPLFTRCATVGASASTMYGTTIECSFSPANTNSMKDIYTAPLAHTLGAYNGNSIPVYNSTGTLLGYIPLYS